MDEFHPLHRRMGFPNHGISKRVYPTSKTIRASAFGTMQGVLVMAKISHPPPERGCRLRRQELQLCPPGGM